MIKCDKCNVQAINFQKYSGSHLCRAHFDDDLHRKVKETIRQARIFGHGAKIAVALDGGKDSSVLAYILKNLFRERQDIEIMAVIIDLGVAGYSTQAIESAKSLAEKLQLNPVSFSFKENYGTTIDQIGSEKNAQSICEMCSCMRRTLLNKAALDLKADVLATGQNLDDQAQMVMQSYLRGDLSDLFHQKPGSSESVPIIRPLIRVPEREVALYAIIHGLHPWNQEACPYRDAMQTEIRAMLNEFESRHPGTKYSLLRSMERIIEVDHAGAKPLRADED